MCCCYPTADLRTDSKERVEGSVSGVAASGTDESSASARTSRRGIESAVLAGALSPVAEDRPRNRKVSVPTVFPAPTLHPAVDRLRGDAPDSRRGRLAPLLPPGSPARRAGRMSLPVMDRRMLAEAVAAAAVPDVGLPRIQIPGPAVVAEPSSRVGPPLRAEAAPELKAQVSPDVSPRPEEQPSPGEAKPGSAHSSPMASPAGSPAGSQIRQSNFTKSTHTLHEDVRYSPVPALHSHLLCSLIRY